MPVNKGMKIDYVDSSYISYAVQYGRSKDTLYIEIKPGSHVIKLSYAKAGRGNYVIRSSGDRILVFDAQAGHEYFADFNIDESLMLWKPFIIDIATAVIQSKEIIGETNK
jgi:hypothetical protein